MPLQNEAKLFLPTERVALFIDGANLYSASRNLGFDVDYRNLLEYFRRQAHVIRAYYYSAVLETEEYSPLKPLTDWLAYNGYTLVTKPAKEFTDSAGRRRVKGNMDIEVAVDMLELAPQDRPRRAVQRRFRFPPPRGGGAAQGRARLGRVSRSAPARRWSPTNCAARRTSSWSSPRSRPNSPAARWSRGRGPRRCVRRPPNPMRIRPTPRDSPLGNSVRAADPGVTTPAAGALARSGLSALPRLAASGRRTATPIRTGSTRRSRASGRERRPLLIVGMAPGLRGANRTGRPFTGDHAGVLLYETLLQFGLAEGTYRAEPDDGLTLNGCRIVNAVRCVPPANLPEPEEVAHLQPLSRGRIADHAERAGGAGPRRRWPTRPCCKRLRHPANAHPLPAWRRAYAAGRAAAGGQLSCVPIQHEHRPADRGDVRGRDSRSVREARLDCLVTHRAGPRNEAGWPGTR